MTLDAPFRWLMLASHAPFLALVHLQLFRIQPTRSTFYDRNEPLLLAAAVRVCVVPCILASILYMIDPRWLRWSSLALPEVWRWSGLPLLLATQAMFLWSLWALGRNFSVSLAIYAQHELIQHGPYRWLRHPMYASLLAMCPALLLVTSNWFIAGSLAAAGPLVLFWRIPLEEAKLRARFGARYDVYAQGAGRYWPHATRLDATLDSEELR